jgi:hypothetical protein
MNQDAIQSKVEIGNEFGKASGIWTIETFA